jgi:hypothetical protein
MASTQNQVRPNYGPVPRGKANIMKQGFTENSSNAWGANPMAETVVDNPREYPTL